jgi:hypothetical protein
MYADRSGRRSCFVRNSRGQVFLACVRIRFHGKNSVRERGLGMTILEKLERQGLITE